MGFIANVVFDNKYTPAVQEVSKRFKFEAYEGTYRNLKLAHCICRDISLEKVSEKMRSLIMALEDKEIFALRKYYYHERR